LGHRLGSAEIEFALVAFPDVSEATKAIGPFFTPGYIIITPGLPETRSGKIMR
jgi:acyl-coenzyme A synthetase/AMP-(fatty) acid ligase